MRVFKDAHSSRFAGKMDPPASPLAHKAATAGCFLIRRMESILPEQIWQAGGGRPWHTKYGIIVDCNHHDDSWLDKRGQIPFLYPEFLKYRFVKKNQFLIFLALTWKGYNWWRLRSPTSPRTVRKAHTQQAIWLEPGEQQSPSQHQTPTGPDCFKARTRFTSFG
jgi:hypothetical protein